MDDPQNANPDNSDAGAGAGQDGGQEHGGEFKGNSLLTRPDGEDAGKAGDSKPEDVKEPDKEAGNEDPADKVPDKPDGYAIKFAETTQVDKELLTGFVKEAHTLGIKPSQAQKLATMYESYASKAGERQQAEQQKVLEAAKAQWEADIQKSPTYKQEFDHARTALREYGDQELYDLLDQTNLGSHPKMWAFLAKVGKELAEPGSHGKGGGAQEPSLAKRMWPNM